MDNIIERSTLCSGFREQFDFSSRIGQEGFRNENKDWLR